MQSQGSRFVIQQPERYVVYFDDHMVRIAIKPPAFLNAPTVSVLLTREQFDGGYQRWLQGALIQDALPDLTLDQRERLKTGLSI